MQLIARIISFITNPVIIALPAPFLIIFKVTDNALYALKWELFSFVFILINVAFIGYGIIKGFFSDFDLTIKDERRKFFVFASITTIIYLFIVLFLNGPRELVIAILGFQAGILIFSIVHRFLKASFHVATITAFILSMAFLYGSYFYYAIPIIPIVAWSRIRTHHHTLSEVIVGGVLGAVIVVGIFAVAKLFLFY